MESEIQKKVKKQGLIVSRIPEWAKKFIIERAEAEFCGDYGMTLAAISKEAIEYLRLKEMFFNEGLIDKLVSKGNTQQGERVITFADGRKIKVGGNADGED